MIDLAGIKVSTAASVKEVVAAIDRSERAGIALVVDERDRLLNTLTDGDVRRGLLTGLELASSVVELLKIKRRMPHPEAVTCPIRSSLHDRAASATANGVWQIPIVDDERRVVDIFLLRDVFGVGEAEVQAVVMAGGFGKRLHPLTQDTPKPMLPVGGRPMLEIVLERLRLSGVKKCHIATHFKSEKIREHFGCGSEFGIDIAYIVEDRPLGTAGSLGKIIRPQGDLIVTNGDVLTKLDYCRILEYHRQQKASMTMAVQAYEHVVPFGVVKISEFDVVAIEEKPTCIWHVSAGIYVLSPPAIDFIGADEYLDMPDLISRILASGHRVSSFLIQEPWLDIGQPSDYQRAVLEAAI
jgi:dTDP-glucose pyrophosphorylase/CBS domain-containing protein